MRPRGTWLVFTGSTVCWTVECNTERQASEVRGLVLDLQTARRILRQEPDTPKAVAGNPSGSRSPKSPGPFRRPVIAGRMVVSGKGLAPTPRRLQPSGGELR